MSLPTEVNEMDIISEALKVSLKSCASDNCSECRYYKYKSTCQNDLAKDALKYIEKLEVISNVTMLGASKEGEA